jgi:hypothetical protein
MDDQKPRAKSPAPRPDNHVGRIDKVDAAPVERKSSLVSFVNAVNPLGFVQDAYAKAIAYRIEVKRLDIELHRINKQAELQESFIDKSFQLEMEKLKQRRVIIEQHYATVQQELRQKHIERMKVLEWAETAFKYALDPNLPLEAKQFYQDMHKQCMEDVHRFGMSASASLDTLLKALPPMQVSGLLNPPEN